MARLLLAALLVLTAASHGDAEPPGHRSLTGRLLVATESLRDPRFAKSVIYIVRHDERGAFGLIINFVAGDVPWERVLYPFDLEPPPHSGDVRVHHGGPVDQNRGMVLHTPDWTTDGTIVVDGGFAVSDDPQVLLAMAKKTGPRKALFMLGHAGWAPGQLDAELTTRAWAVARADERLVFDEKPNQKWIEAMARRLLDL